MSCSAMHTLQLKSRGSGIVLQRQVDKAYTPDYNSTIDPSEERWLGLIRDKLLSHSYSTTDEMLADVALINRCATRYHRKKTNQDRNLRESSDPLDFCCQLFSQQSCFPLDESLR